MPKFAQRMTTMHESALVIRNLFSALNDPGIISFGGGAPAKEALPVDIIRQLTAEVITKEGRGIEAMQYGGVMGVTDLRQVICDQLLAPKGVKGTVDNVMIVNGGLETMNLACQLYIDKGDVILCEEPTFVQAVEIFEMFEAKCVGVKMEEDGLNMEDLEAKIKKHNPKMIYVIPTFQNPSGRTLALEKRQKLAELGSRYDVIVLEDDPYRDIRYSGTDLPPIKAFDKTGHTILANSFSKIFSPGCRLGYVFADESIIEKFFDAKTATNSHTSTYVQVLCAEFFKRGYYPQHHKDMCDLYRVRRDKMIECIDKYFPKGTKRTFPDGGLFTWVELPGGADAAQLLEQSVKEIKVAFLAGEPFFTEPGLGKNCMRISFGNVTPEIIQTGMEKLGKFLCEKLEK